MQKDHYVMAGGVAAVGAVVFGCGLLAIGSFVATPAATLPTQAVPKEAAVAKHEAGPAAQPQSPAAKGESSREELARFTTRYNDMLVRGNFDDARVIASQALKLAGPTNPTWLRHLADAIYQSEGLPLQQRLAKAYETYATLLAHPEGPADMSEDREWAQYRVCVCLYQMGRCADAMQAGVVYTQEYPGGAHRPEVRLLLARGMLANGQPAEARAELAGILAENPPPQVRASVLIESAQADRARTVGDATKTPNGETAGDNTTVNGIPSAEWSRIRATAQTGNVDEAQTLLNAWLNASGGLTDAQRAQAALGFAKVLRELATTEN